MAKPAGRIQVVPAMLAQASAEVGTASGSVGYASTCLAASAVGEAGCDPAAQGAFAAMQAAWSRQTAFLMASVGGLRAALSQAATAYPANDEAQLVAVWLSAEPGRRK